jgi:hypothetical protein
MELALGDPVQLVVERREELVRSGPIPGLRGLDEPTDRLIHH